MDFSDDLPIPITTSRSDLAWLFEISWALSLKLGSWVYALAGTGAHLNQLPTELAMCITIQTSTFPSAISASSFSPPTNWPILLFTRDVPVGQLKSIVHAYFSCQILPCSCLLFYRISMSSCTSVSWMGSSLLQRTTGWSWSILLSMKTSWLCRTMRSPVCERLGYLL